MSQQRFFIPEEMAKKKLRKKNMIFVSMILAVVVLSALITFFANQL